MNDMSFSFHHQNSILDALYPENPDQFANMTRYEKGYVYEMQIQNLLADNKLEYIGNPTDFEEWKRHTKTGFDAQIRDPKNGSWIRIECKLILKSLYNSWVFRDWVSRSANIIVTNDPYALSYKQRRMLKENGKKLFSTDQFLSYIQKLLRGNKYNLNRSSIVSYNKNSYHSSGNTIDEKNSSEREKPDSSNEKDDSKDVSKEILPESFDVYTKMRRAKKRMEWSVRMFRKQLQNLDAKDPMYEYRKEELLEEIRKESKRQVRLVYYMPPKQKKAKNV